MAAINLGPAPATRHRPQHAGGAPARGVSTQRPGFGRRSAVPAAGACVETAARHAATVSAAETGRARQAGRGRQGVAGRARHCVGVGLVRRPGRRRQRRGRSVGRAVRCSQCADSVRGPAPQSGLPRRPHLSCVMCSAIGCWSAACSTTATMACNRRRVVLGNGITHGDGHPGQLQCPGPGCPLTSMGTWYGRRRRPGSLLAHHGFR